MEIVSSMANDPLAPLVYYASLGVKRAASAKAIRSAYRKLAHKDQPDVNPNNREAEATFKEINEAYEVFSDLDKRKKYDQFGSGGLVGQLANEPARFVGAVEPKLDQGGPAGGYLRCCQLVILLMGRPVVAL